MLAGLAHHVPECPAFVPGIRLCGHGRSLMADRRMLPALRYFWRITRRGETVEVRAFEDRLQQKFVLSLTVADRVRAIGDRASCFGRPYFVLSLTVGRQRRLVDSRIRTGHRQSVVLGQSVSEMVDLGVRRTIKK